MNAPLASGTGARRSCDAVGVGIGARLDFMKGRVNDALASELGLAGDEEAVGNLISVP